MFDDILIITDFVGCRRAAMSYSQGFKPLVGDNIFFAP